MDADDNNWSQDSTAELTLLELSEDGTHFPFCRNEISVLSIKQPEYLVTEVNGFYYLTSRYALNHFY